MRRIILASCATSLLGLAGTATAAPPSQIDVMTQNQYLGADLNPVVAACSAGGAVACNAAIVTALAKVALTMPEQRYVALAREIAGRRPHVVGLQEVFEFACVPAPAGDPTFDGLPDGNGCAFGPIAGAFSDHLDGTVDALGGKYVPKAIVENLDIWLPVGTPIGGAYVHVLDRDVILVRSDLEADASVVPFPCGSVGGHSLTSVDGCNYQFVAATSINGTPLRIERGFVGVDLTVGSKTYRIVNTHLEVRDPDGTSDSRIVQAAQAYQLKQFVLQTLSGQTLVVVGDFNSAPEDVPVSTIYGLAVPPYMQFANALGAGDAAFTDAWTKRPGASTGRGAPLIGLSCCQEEDLENQKSMLYERIDLIWSLNSKVKVMDARLLGETTSSKTPPAAHGLWPSDHVAVAATLRY